VFGSLNEGLEQDEAAALTSEVQNNVHKQSDPLMNPDGEIGVPYFMVGAGQGFTITKLAGESSENTYSIFLGQVIYPTSESITFSIIAKHTQDAMDLAGEMLKKRDVANEVSSEIMHFYIAVHKEALFLKDGGNLLK